MEEEDWGFTSDIYQCFFQMNFEWPCLSFDVLRDNMGTRRDFPLSAYFVSATQAEEDDDNQLLVTKISDLVCTKNDDNAEEDLPDPKIRCVGNFHPFTANRVRSMPQTPNIVATWTTNNCVTIWDVKAAIEASNTDNDKGEVVEIFQCPMNDEGYGLAWSKVTPGTLAVGACDGQVSLWTQGGGSFSMLSVVEAHQASVEDIVFSPNDDGIFATASADGTICIWDSRDLTAPMIKCQAHNTDCNVIDWNANLTYSLASGDDDGVFKVWDLRSIKEDPSPSAAFDYHQEAITSIEWNPNDEAELAVASAEGRLTVWDLASEAVDPEEREEGIPDQMMFEHTVAEPKELHYHPQIPGMIAVTGITFDVFIPDIVEDDGAVAQ